MKQITAILFFLFSTLNIATAATVDTTNSAVFSFDVSALGAEDITGYYYSTSGTGDNDRLSSGATMLLSFGSNAGKDDIGSYEFTNPFDFAINNVSTGTSPIGLQASLDLLYVTVGFVDDIFGIENFSLYTSLNARLTGTYEGSISAVPLPAAAWFFGTALLAFTGFSRRKKTV